MTLIPLLHPRVPTKSWSVDALMRVADGSQYPVPLRFKALVALGEKLGFEPSLPESGEEVLRAVMRDERAPMDLRLRAAGVLIRKPAGDSGIAHGD